MSETLELLDRARKNIFKAQANVEKLQKQNEGLTELNKIKDKRIRLIEKQNKILMEACEKAINVNTVLQQTIILEQAISEAKKVINNGTKF